MKRMLLAAVAAAALLVALPAAEPVSAQIDSLPEDSCTTAVVSSRVISEVKHGDVVERRQIQQTVVDRCTRSDGTTYDGESRYVTFWQQLV